MPVVTHAVSRALTGRAPTRVDLGGGWTDVPPYCEREGGFVCNVAITRYAMARLSPLKGKDWKPAGADAALIGAALRRAGVTDAMVTLKSGFPVAAGLGGSSAASAALLGALAEWTGQPWAPSEIAEAGRRIEVEELGIAGGRQDHYAATHGGVLALTFSRSTSVRRLRVGADTLREFVRRSVLVYTGESRVSGSTITAVLGAYEAGERRVVDALRRMRELAAAMADTLETGDLDGLGEQIAEHWAHQRALHASIPTARIDEIVARARAAGALGAKATGASGGGCVLILSRATNTAAVRQAVSPLGEVLEFGIDMDGLTVAADDLS